MVTTKNPLADTTTALAGALLALHVKWNRQLDEAKAKASDAAAMHSLGLYAREAERAETLKQCIADLQDAVLSRAEPVLYKPRRRRPEYDRGEPCHNCGAMPTNDRTGLCRPCDDGGYDDD